MASKIYAATRKGLFEIAKSDHGFQIARTWFLGDAVSIVYIDPRDGAIYAGLGLGHFGVKLHRSDDGGNTFVEVAAPAFPKVPDGVEEKTADGKAWPWRVEQIWALQAGHGSETGVLWCGTIGGGLFRSADRGASWELNAALWNHAKRVEWTGGGADLPAIHSICVHPHTPNDIVVGVSCGGAWRTRDGGQSWSIASQGMRADFMPEARRYDPYVQDPHLVVQCDAQPQRLWTQHHNGIFRSDDRGDSWVSLDNATPSVFGFAVAVHPQNPDIAWFVPAVKDEHRIPVDGKLVVSVTQDAGKTFAALRSGLPQEHAYDIALRHALDVNSDGKTLAFGSTTGSLFVSENAGEDWATVSTHLPPIYAVRVLSGGA